MSTSAAVPPGPSFRTEWRRPFSEVAEEIAHGLLVHVRSRFERFGDIYHLDNWGTPVYVTRHPDHAHEVLVKRQASFTKRTRDLEAFLGEGLLTSDGETWRRHRRMIQPAFAKQSIVRAARVMEQLGPSRIAAWGDGAPLDLNREMMELTLSVVSKALLDFDSDGASGVVAKTMHVLQSTAGLDIFPKWMPNPIRAKKRRATQKLHALIDELVDERRASPRYDLVSMLLSTEDGMSNAQIRDELVTLFLAGHETTALALTWTMYLLAKHPAHEKVLHDELSEVLGDRDPTYEDLERLEWTRLCIQEAMRMFPPLYILPRVASEDTELGGYPIPKGAEVLVWVYFVHHDARWFPEPGAFRPQRFVSGSGEVTHPHAYLPFGAGPRACIGKHFAMVEAQLLLAQIARRWSLGLEPGQDVRLAPRVTLGPNRPIRMISRRR